MPRTWSVPRTWNAVVAALVAVAVVLEVTTALADGPGVAGSMAERLTRLFSYFTILSNLLVGLACALLAADPQRDGRVFRVLRLDAVLCIAVTGIVYNAVLRDVGPELAPAGVVSNTLLHVVVPILAVLGWVLYGPRPRIDAATVGWSLAFPLAWIAYTFVRGAIVDFYPYPFLDVSVLGYGRALAATAAVAVVFLVLAALAGRVDRALPPTGAAPSQVSADPR